MISPVLPEHSGQYWCVAKYGGKSSEYGISLNVLMQTRYEKRSSSALLMKFYALDMYLRPISTELPEIMSLLEKP